jgi:hypothetical protein
MYSLAPIPDKPGISTLTVDATHLNGSALFISCHKKHDLYYARFIG